MNNSIKIRNSKEIIGQLKRAEVQKSILIKNIYKEYEIYFQIVRESILPASEKGIFCIHSDLFISDKVLNSRELNIFLNKNISSFIHSKLPLITIEQLKLGDIDNHQNHLVNLNTLKEFEVVKEYQILNLEHENELITKECSEFNYNNNLNTYQYYESLREDELTSLNLDENSYLNYFSQEISTEKIENEKHILNAVLELIEETNDNKLNNYEKLNEQESNVFISSDNLNVFDFIDKSFSNFLLNLSYKVNTELFKKKLIKKIISEETFIYLSTINYITKHPHPFVIKYDLNPNNLSAINIKTSDIYLFNITNVEMEFYNLDLSICRNNINDLKNKLRLLNKKQRYWEKKEITLNSTK